MLSKTQITATLAVTAVLGLTWGSTEASATPLEYAFAFSTQAPMAPTGLTSRLVYGTSANGEPRPVAAERVVLPAHSRFDESVVPACTASDEELYVLGTSACPESSQVGGGSGTVDTGCGPPIDPVRGDIYVFHEPHQLVFVGTPPGSHDVATISRFTIAGRVLEISSIPVTPGCPPGGETVGAEVEVTLQERTEGSRGFLTTPPTCRRGTWTSRLVVTYRDGSSETAKSKTPCRV